MKICLHEFLTANVHLWEPLCYLTICVNVLIDIVMVFRELWPSWFSWLSGSYESAGGYPDMWAGRDCTLLPGLHVRAVWQPSGSGEDAQRDHALSSAITLCRGQAVCLLVSEELQVRHCGSNPLYALSCSKPANLSFSRS